MKVFWEERRNNRTCMHMSAQKPVITMIKQLDERKLLHVRFRN